MALNDRSRLEVYDSGAGVITVRWSTFSSVTPDSYNVYVDGALNANVAGLSATIVGLLAASVHSIFVTAVKTGVEIARSMSAAVTIAPSSSMGVTLMKRPFPYPSTGA